MTNSPAKSESEQKFADPSIDASAGLRPENTAGYCVFCNKIVRRNEAAECIEGHPEFGVSGLIEVAAGQNPPYLPRFNWAAFLMPPIWGIAHGAYAGIIVLPLWLFMDSVLRSAVYGVGPSTPLLTRVGVYAMAVLIVALTIGLMGWFGSRGWGLAWRKQYGSGRSQMPFDIFIKKQRRWIWFCAPWAIALLGLGVYYWLAILPAQMGS